MVFQNKYFFTKEKLEGLYINQKLSLNQVSKELNCSGTTVLRALENFNIKRRPAYFKKVDIPKEVLYDLYWTKGMKPDEIGKIYGIRGRGVRKKLKKFGISKTLSQAMTTKKKNPFSGNLAEKAYLLGLRTGDFHVKRKDFIIRAQTTTTHPAQIELAKSAFDYYGKALTYLTDDYGSGKEWFVYSDLNSSFEFLLEKPQEIPKWILDNKTYFYNFLAAYMDSEGSWCVKQSHEKFVRFVFEIKSCDYLVLKQIKKKLNYSGCFCWLYLSVEKGTKTSKGILNENLYHLVVYRKEDIICLSNNLLRFSKHPEKIEKMNYILENKDNNNWNDISINWKKIIDNIKSTILK